MKTSPELHIVGNIIYEDCFESMKKIPVELQAYQGEGQPFRFTIRHFVIEGGELEFEIDQLAARQIASFIVSHLKIDEKCIQ
jgi:hypothetical protein